MLKLVPAIEWSPDCPPPGRLDWGFVDVADISGEALAALLERHFETLRVNGDPLESTCPLIGGLILELDGRRVLYPQCCGDISEIASWMAVVDLGFTQGFVATSGHPSPEVFVDEKGVRIVCFDRDEEFQPSSQHTIEVSSQALKQALDRAQLELRELESRIRSCPIVDGNSTLARRLVFG